MNNIYNEAIQKVNEGAKYHIDFQQRSLKINGQYIIRHGEYEGELGIDPSSKPLPFLAQLFHRYQHSVPSERSESKKRKYFNALPEHELTDEDMLYGESRETAQIRLELYVLIMILNGSLKWDEFAKDKWFWQGPDIKELILLKEWIEPKTENNNIK